MLSTRRVELESGIPRGGRCTRHETGAGFPLLWCEMVGCGVMWGEMEDSGRGLAMFLGTYTPKLDDKGRFVLPAKFRERLAEGLVITRQKDRCLAIWTTQDFISEISAVATGPSTDREIRDYQRMVASGASDELPDAQGRITISPSLRTYAGLEKEIVVIGALNRLEIWDAGIWARYENEREHAFADLDGGESEDPQPTTPS